LFDVRTRDQKKSNVCKFFVSEEIFTNIVCFTNTFNIGVELVIETTKNLISNEFFEQSQYPGKYGQVYGYADFIKKKLIMK
jgi:glycine dehydrogenase